MRMHPRRAIVSSGRIAGFVWLLVFISANQPARGADTPKPSYDPKVVEASDEAAKAIRTIRLPKGVAPELFAAEPMLANPVAFCFDEKGRVYVAETFRHHAGVTDIRGHMDWLDDDLASRTVADRVAMYRKHLGSEFGSFETEHDRVRRIIDKDGDGKADHATVFADGFKSAAVGIGAGLLARKGDVWFTCIPWLVKLRDDGSDKGTAASREVLLEGFGVHVGFLGHDLHGLKFGPDGRIYFSIGDRGINVKTKEGATLAVLDTGTILRCEPDGRNLEVVAYGLRNPQELVFDKFGNLFTCDNNSDSGDKARWVQVIEGGDSGWRIGYQFIQSPISRGPWNEEKLWFPAFEGQAAYIVPPIANFSDGPSGLTVDPGVSLLPDRYKDHFFLADFRGASGQSGVRSFAVAPKGAGFSLVDSEQFAWSTLATDVDFGPDGGLYVTDWVEGWEKPNKGRLYRLVDPSKKSDPKVTEVKRLLAEGMEARSVEELSGLLAHDDMRIRQEAQFELAARGKSSLEPLAAVSLDRSKPLMARIHALWGAGQIARKEQGVKLWATFGPLVKDPDEEMRVQAARVFGDLRDPDALFHLVNQLPNKNHRVRLFAAIALGRIGSSEAIAPLIALLRENNDADPIIRHGAVMGLAGTRNVSALVAAANDRSAGVRMGILLALRRLRSPEVARFLDDPEPRVVIEAARAINDEPIKEALPRLAASRVKPSDPATHIRRVLNANYRLGGSVGAAGVAEIASRGEFPEDSRRTALEMLIAWAKPSGRDRVVGVWRPIPERAYQDAAYALRPRLSILLTSAPESIRELGAHAASELGMADYIPELLALANDSKRADATRAEAIQALDALNAPARVEAARKHLEGTGPLTRTTALRVLTKHEPASAVPVLGKTLESGSTDERQGAFQVLSGLSTPAAANMLADWLDRLIDDKVPAEIRLDIVEAAASRNEPELKAKLKKYEDDRPKSDPLSAYRNLLDGGDSSKGREIFFSKADVYCLRCHKAKLPGEGEAAGGEVGPDLSAVASRLKRDELLESIAEPDRKIAQGFESIVVATDDGKIHSGVFRGEDAKEVRLMTADGKLEAIPKDTIEDRKRGPSAMPTDLVKKLSKRELRDLVAFLATLNGK